MGLFWIKNFCIFRFIFFIFGITLGISVLEIGLNIASAIGQTDIHFSMIEQERNGLEIEFLPPDFANILPYLDMDFFRAGVEAKIGRAFVKATFVDALAFRDVEDFEYKEMHQHGLMYLNNCLESESDLEMLPEHIKAELLRDLPPAKTKGWSFWPNLSKSLNMTAVRERWLKIDPELRYDMVPWDKLNLNQKNEVFFTTIKNLIGSMKSINDVVRFKPPTEDSAASLSELYKLFKNMNFFMDANGSLEINYKEDHIVRDTGQFVHDLLLVADFIGKKDAVLHPSKYKDPSQRLSWHRHLSRLNEIPLILLELYEDNQMLRWLKLGKTEILTDDVMGYSGSLRVPTRVLDDDGNRPDRAELINLVRGIVGYGDNQLNRAEFRQHIMYLLEEIELENQILSLPTEQAIALLRLQNQNMLRASDLTDLVYFKGADLYFRGVDILVKFLYRNKILSSSESMALESLEEVLTKDESYSVNLQQYLNDTILGTERFYSSLLIEVDLQNRDFFSINQMIKFNHLINFNNKFFDKEAFSTIKRYREKLTETESQAIKTEVMDHLSTLAINDIYIFLALVNYDHFTDKEKLEILNNLISGKSDVKFPSHYEFLLKRLLMFYFLRDTALQGKVPTEKIGQYFFQGNENLDSLFYKGLDVYITKIFTSSDDNSVYELLKSMENNPLDAIKFISNLIPTVKQTEHRESNILENAIKYISKLVSSGSHPQPGSDILRCESLFSF